MKILSRILGYSWKYFVFTVIVFVVFWHLLSVRSAVRTAEDKFDTALEQNVVALEASFLNNNAVEFQKTLWQIKNDSIVNMKFFPSGKRPASWMFKEVVVGELLNRTAGILSKSARVISNGAELGRLEYSIDLVYINASVFKQNNILFITVVFFFLGLLVISNLGAIQTLLAIEQAVNEINTITTAGRGDIIRDSIKKNISRLPAGIIGTPFAQMTGRMSNALSQAVRLESELAVSKAVSDIAAQVAHDIRSPLVALDAALKNTSQLPEKQRVIVRHAVNRIRDIANNLLEKNRQQAGTAVTAAGVAGGQGAGEAPAVHLLSSLIDPVITEKRLSFESKPGINIDFKLTRESYGLFASIQPIEFRRMLSNLVNNAVEALGDKGAVDVSLTHDEKNIILTVSDNGKGIPPTILAKLGRKGETHGKAGGSGLGLFHARTTAESWGGSLAITSTPGQGTAVTIKLPKAAAPADFVPALEISPGRTVVVLDDDATIHQVWQGRFDSARVREHDIEIFQFSEPDKLREWVKSTPIKAGNALYLFDYELLGYKETGTSLAEELGLCGKTILVTSRCEEQRIIEECARLNIRMIPKGLVGFVPITIGAPAAPALAVLIDDDAMVHMNWEDAAERAGVELKAFKTPAEFLANLAAFSKDTPIYIDSELGDDIKGEEIAADLKEKGFTNLRLATGHPPENFSRLPWLKVVGKESPWRT